LEALATRAGRDTVVSNVGNDREISIRELAELVIQRAGSRSVFKDVPLREAYGEDFEDIRRRRPDLARLRGLTGFQHRYTLEQTIDDLVALARPGIQHHNAEHRGHDGDRTVVRNQPEYAA
jgi:UDP-glucose 4-epimerase